MENSTENSTEKKYAPLCDFATKITDNNLQQYVFKFHNTLNETQTLSFRDIRDYKYTLQQLRTGLSLIADLSSEVHKLEDLEEVFEEDSELLLAKKISTCFICNDQNELEHSINLNDDDDDDDDSFTLFGGDKFKALICSLFFGLFQEVNATETVINFTDSFFENFLESGINEKLNLEIQKPELKKELNSLDHNVINIYDDFTDELYDEYNDTDDVDIDFYIDEIDNAIEQFELQIRLAIKQLNMIIKGLKNIKTFD